MHVEEIKQMSMIYTLDKVITTMVIRPLNDPT